MNLERSLYALLFNRTGMGTTGETLIVDRNAMALSELRWHNNAPLRLKIDAEPAVLAARGKTGITEAKDYRCVPVLAAYAPIHETGWGFVAKQDLEEVYAPIYTMLRDIGILFGLSAVIVWGFAFFLARGIARPVIQMTEVSKKIAKGNLSARNSVAGRDELGFLAESFNAMADAVMSHGMIQKSSADITETLVAAGKMDDFRKSILKQLMKATDSNLGAYHALNLENGRFVHVASAGITAELLEPFDGAFLDGEFGEALTTKRIGHIKDIPENTRFKFKTFSGTLLPKEIMTIPLVVNNTVRAVISLAGIHPYSKGSLEIVNRIRPVINTKLSNLLANEETKRLYEELSEKNQELQSQTEELRQTSEELQEQNLELEVQRRQVEAANSLKSEFLSNMSHELRTPLNSIMALSRVLMMRTKEKLSEEEAGYLEIIERNGKDLLSLINDILDLSKIEAGKMEINPKLFSVAATIETIMERIEPIAGEKGLTLHQTIPSDLPPIERDETRVHQILQNLVANAVKFTNRGGVTISASRDANRLHIDIADTGIGIAEKDLSHIFEEFRQVDGTTTRHYEGTGLGLAIAYRATEMLNGNLSVNSTLGRGATFRLTLPIRWRGLVPALKSVVFRPPPADKSARKTLPGMDDASEPSAIFCWWKTTKRPSSR